MRIRDVRLRVWARAAAGEGGQVLPFVAPLFLCVLLGLAGMVIDLGNGYLQGQAIQNVADASALAGAEAIPQGTWSSAAQTYAVLNDEQGDQITVTYNGTDSVTVGVTRTVPTYLMRLFGMSTITVSRYATATIMAIGQAAGHIAPYAVTQQVYDNGQGTVLFNENQPGAYGTVDLPATTNTSGGSCSGTTDKGTPTNVQNELNDTLPSGALVVGGCLSVKSGASQPAANVVTAIAPGDNEMQSDLEALGDGTYQIVHQSWDDANGLPPRLIYVPIVTSLPSGNGDATITGFAWFYMTGASGGGSSLTITGQYVTIDTPTAAPTVKYVPGEQGELTTVELTS